MARSGTFDRIFGGTAQAPSAARETLCDKPLVSRSAPREVTRDTRSSTAAGKNSPGRETVPVQEREDFGKGFVRGKLPLMPSRSDSMKDIIKMDKNLRSSAEEAPVVRDQPTLNKTSTTYERDLPLSHKVGAVMGPPGIFSQSPGGDSIYVALSNGSYRIKEPLAARTVAKGRALPGKEESHITGEEAPTSTHADGADGPSSQCDVPLKKYSEDISNGKSPTASVQEGPLKSSDVFQGASSDDAKDTKVSVACEKRSPVAKAAHSPSPRKVADALRVSPHRRRVSWSKKPLMRGVSAPSLDESSQKRAEEPASVIVVSSEAQSKQKGPPIGSPPRTTRYLSQPSSPPRIEDAQPSDNLDSHRPTEAGMSTRPRSPSPTKVSSLERSVSSPVLAKGSLWSKLDNSLKEEYHVQRSDNDNDVVILTRKSPCRDRDRERLDSHELHSNSDAVSTSFNFDPQRREPKPLRFSVVSNTQISGAERRHYSPLSRDKNGISNIFKIPEQSPTTGVAEISPKDKLASSELDLEVLLTAESMVQRAPKEATAKQRGPVADQLETKQLRVRETVSQKCKQVEKQRWR